jgi:hypothetical protein
MQHMTKKISIATGCLIFSALLISSATTAAKPGRTWVKIKGEIYGAKPDERGPIGGGNGYRNGVRGGDFQVRTVEELAAALKKAKAGQTVFVPGDVELDCTDLIFVEDFHIEIPAGVTLAGDRGNRGSAGALICSDNYATRPLIRVLGPDVRITGLRLRGPDPKRHLEHHKRSFNTERGDGKQPHEYYYKLPMSVGIQTESGNLEVDNCELSGWSVSAVSLAAGENHHIHHNYIHHNQLNGLGYGISHGNIGTISSLIECNLFDFNRHSIAGTGAPGNRYEARNNVELGESLSHNFDMHGGRDRQDGTDIAGTTIEICNNTFRAPQPAVVIRGVPETKCDVHHNWFVRHAQPQQAVRAAAKTHVYDNACGAEARVVP